MDSKLLSVTRLHRSSFICSLWLVLNCFEWVGGDRVDLTKPVSDVRLYVRTSTKSFFNFSDIWYVGRGRRVMHDGMQYNPIQGQGHEPL